MQAVIEQLHSSTQIIIYLPLKHTFLYNQNKMTLVNFYMTLLHSHHILHSLRILLV